MRISITNLRRIVLRAMPVILVHALSGCAPEGSSDADAGEGLDFEALSATLLARMDLQPGERVLLVGEGGSRWDAIVPLLRAGVRAAGGVDLGAVDVRGAVLGADERADPDAGSPAEFAAALGTAPEGWAEPLATVDVAVKLPGAAADPTLDNDVYRALQDVLRSGRGRTVHFHWAGATSFEMEEFAADDRVDRVYQTAVLDTDYAALADALAAFEAALTSGPGAGDDARRYRHHLPCGRRTGDAPGRGRVGCACGTCAQPDRSRGGDSGGRGEGPAGAGDGGGQDRLPSRAVGR